MSNITTTANHLALLFPLINFGSKFSIFNQHCIKTLNQFFTDNNIEKTVQEIKGVNLSPYTEADYDLEKVYDIFKTFIPDSSIPENVNSGKSLLKYIIDTSNTFSNIPISMPEYEWVAISKIYKRAAEREMQRWMVCVSPNDVAPFIPFELEQEFRATLRAVNGKRITGNMNSSMDTLNKFYVEEGLTPDLREIREEMNVKINFFTNEEAI